MRRPIALIFFFTPLLVPLFVPHLQAEPADPAFYVPENPASTILDSARDSVRFTLEKTVRRDRHGHLVSISSFVDPAGQVMGWHDFGNLEGPGWACNAVAGAYELYLLGALLNRPEWQRQAIGILDHVLEGGFVDAETGLIRGYRETTTGKLCLNYKHNSDWFCPGSMAKIALQLLVLADQLDDNSRATRMRDIAVRCATWIDTHVEQVPNGWFPRRVTPAGKIYRKSPDGGDYPFWQTSADGLFIVQLQAALTYFEAAADCRSSDPAKSRDFELTRLVILRAIAKHHYGAHGFLTEGVDWNDHVGQQHHIGQAKYAAIRYTEPFLNNQHIVEPTVFYLKHLA